MLPVYLRTQVDKRLEAAVFLNSKNDFFDCMFAKTLNLGFSFLTP